jgi:hypothetical protein
MSQPYPLYDELLNKANQNANHQIDATKLSLTINGMANYMTKDEYIEHYKEIQALIDHYAYLKCGSLNSNTPCGGKAMSGDSLACKGVLYAISDDNPLLIRIIAEYLEKYS